METRSDQISKPGYLRSPRLCVRCGGDGVWKGWFRGVCFRCGGCGQDPTPDRTYTYPAAWSDEQVAEHVAKREAAAAKRAARKIEKADAKRDEFAAEFPDVWAALHADDLGSFLASIKCQVYAGKPLSDRQIECVRDGIVRDAERAAEVAAAPEPEPTEDLPTGKAITVEGEVVTVKVQENEWGGTLKMLVVGNGWKVWSTVPSGSGRVAPTDDAKFRVRFTADVEASRNDPSFGIAKRPRKLEVLDEAA